jgi:hypothetical protein
MDGLFISTEDLIFCSMAENENKVLQVLPDVNYRLPSESQNQTIRWFWSREISQSMDA